MAPGDASEGADDTGAWRTVLDYVDAPVVACDLTGRLTYFNPAAVQFWGGRPQPGATWCQGLHLWRDGRRVDARNCLLAEAIREEREACDDNIEFEGGDGVRRRIAVRAAPMRRQGTIIGAFAVARDSVDRRALGLARERLTAIVQSSDDAIISTDIDGVITSWNEGAHRLYGYVAEEMIGRPMSLLIPTDRADEEPGVLGRVLSGATIDHYETFRRRKDGTEVAVSLSVSPVHDDAGVIVGASKIARDVSERHAADLVRSRLAAIVESSDDAIVSKDLHGIITTWNRGAERLFGYAASEAVGKPITILIPPERLDEEPQVLGRIVQGESIEHFETLRRHKNGALLDISLTVSPIRNRLGVIVGASKIARDITERKRAERQLALADQRKDEFIATLSHELRNPLAPLRTSIEVMRTQLDLPPTTQSLVYIMRRQVDHLVRLVDDLLEVSRVSRGTVVLEKVTLLLDDVLRDAVEISRPLIESSAHQLTVALRPGRYGIVGDRVRLVQVFSNLLNNAAKFTPKGGVITLDLQALEQEAIVRIADTGVGIPSDDLENIFGLFTQLAQRHSSGGLGVGLSLARRLVEMHGGSVRASSEGVGHGTTFIVRLPLNLGLGTVISPVLDMPRQGAAARCVMIVDDNQDAADSMAALLTLLGHRIHVAYTAEAALVLGDRVQPEIALLDIGLPGMSGYELAQQIRGRDWGGRAMLVAITGWGQDGDRRRAKAAGFNHHLVKPVRISVLEDLFMSAHLDQ